MADASDRTTRAGLRRGFIDGNVQRLKRGRERTILPVRLRCRDCIEAEDAYFKEWELPKIFLRVLEAELVLFRDDIPCHTAARANGKRNYCRIAIEAK